MLNCINKNSKQYKSWVKAGMSKEEIYTEYVLNNYALPIFEKNVNKALSFPEIKAMLDEFKSFNGLGLSHISKLKHAPLQAVGAFFKDVIYYSDQANAKTISEELGHALLQRFVDPEVHSQMMKAGEILLDQRLKKEKISKKDYLKTLQNTLNISSELAEQYAHEEEIIKDYVLYDTTGTVAQDYRNIERIAEKLSILGEDVANKLAHLINSVIKGLKKLFSSKQQIEDLFELVQSYKKVEEAKYDRGYDSPSYMYIPKGNMEAGVSPFVIQQMVNNAAATYANLYKDGDNYRERVQEIFDDFYEYYDEQLTNNPGDYVIRDLLNASTALELTKIKQDEEESTATQMYEAVASSLKGLGIKIEDRYIYEEDQDDDVENNYGKESYGTNSNENPIDSLSLGLKNIILRAGRKEEFTYNDKTVILTFAPDVDHIYTGLVRFSSEGLNTTERFQKMVEFSSIESNQSSKLLVHDFYINKMATLAKYDNQDLTKEEWIKTILSKDFVFEKVAVNDTTLATELIILIKGLELTSRQMETMEYNFVNNSFNSFNTNSNGADKRLEQTYHTKIANYLETFTSNNQGRIINDVKREEFLDLVDSNRSTEEAYINFLKKAGIPLTTHEEKLLLERVVDEVVYEFREDLRAHIENKKPLFGYSDINNPRQNRGLKELIKLQIKYNESIYEASFKDLEGKTKYGYQRVTPILNIFKGLSNIDRIDSYLEGNPYPGQQDSLTEITYKNNPIVNFYKNLDFVQRQKMSRVFSPDGIYTKEEKGVERQEVAFANMEDRHFAAMTLNLMDKYSETVGGKKIFPITNGHNEASNLIDYNFVPEQEDEVAITNMLSNTRKRIEESAKIMQDFFNQSELLTPDTKEIKVGYEDLLPYFKENNINLYAKYYTGAYMIEDGRVRVLESSGIKAFQIGSNFDNLITREEFFTNELVDLLPLTLNRVEKVVQKQVDELYGKDINLKELLTPSVQANINYYLKQFWYGSTFSNELLFGDPTLSFKLDMKDFLKRHRSYNAAILGVNIPFAVPRWNIIPKSEVKYIISEDDVQEVLGKENEIDNAQSYNSYQFWLEQKFIKGGITPRVYQNFLKSMIGLEIPYSEIKSSGFWLASNKTVGAEGNTVIKQSETTITPREVARIERIPDGNLPSGYEWDVTSKMLKPKIGEEYEYIHLGAILQEKGEEISVINRLYPKRHREDHFNLFALLNGYIKSGNNWKYIGNIDVKIPRTSSKAAQKNVLPVNPAQEFSTNPEYYIQTISAQNYGDQLENPNGKKEVIYPSQPQEIKVNEVSTKDALKLADDYLNNQSKRNNFEIDYLMRTFYGANYDINDLKLNTQELFKTIQNVLKDSGSDSQKVDFFALEKGVAKYNPNIPPVRAKYMQALMKMFTKALKHKVAGTSLVQVSQAGYNLVKRAKVVKDVTYTLEDGSKAVKDVITWDVVSEEEMLNDPNINSEIKDLSKLKYSWKEDNEFTSELTQMMNAEPESTIYFYDNVRFMKPHINENNEIDFYVSETIIPTWFDSEVIPKELKHQYAVRIPSQDKQTSVAVEWVESMGAEKGNTIIVPKEFVLISGSDFDIDKLFTQRYDGYFDENQNFIRYADNFEHFKKWMFENKSFLKDIRKSLRENNAEYGANSKRIKELGKKAKETRLAKEITELTNQRFKLIKENREIFESFVTQALQQLGYPSTQEEYNNYKASYPGAINNENLTNSIKLLSAPEFIYGENSIYESPAGVHKYANMYSKFFTETAVTDEEIERINTEGITDKEGNSLKFEIEDNVLKTYPYVTKSGNKEKSRFVQPSKITQQFSLLNLTYYQRDVQAGQAAIGLAANMNMIGIFAKRNGLSLQDSEAINFEGTILKDIVYTTIENDRVFDNVSSTISTATDELKESQLANHKITADDLKVMLVLMVHGLDLHNAYAITQSPGAKIYKALTKKQLLVKEISYDSKASKISGWLFKHKGYTFDNVIRKEELIQGGSDALKVKYFTMYDKFMTMYDELKTVIPLVKLKSGISSEVDDFLQDQEDVDKVMNPIIQTPNGVLNKFKYYDFRKASSNEEIKQIVKERNRINSSLTNELVEAHPQFRGLKTLLTSVVTKNLRTFNDEVNKYIDGYLLNQNSNINSEKLFDADIKQTILNNLSELHKEYTTSQDKSIIEAEKAFSTIITITKKGELKLNQEGKLTAKRRDLLANSFLILKNSNHALVRELASNLFTYYFVSTGMNYGPGSLEPLFPASFYKDISNIYNDFMNGEKQINTNKFLFHFISQPTGKSYLRDFNSANEVFTVNQGETIIDVVSFNKGEGDKYNSITEIIPGRGPIAFQLKKYVYMLNNGVYLPVNTVAEGLNPFIVNNKQVDENYELFVNNSNKVIKEKVEETPTNNTQQETQNDVKDEVVEEVNQSNIKDYKYYGSWYNIVLENGTGVDVTNYSGKNKDKQKLLNQFNLNNDFDPQSGKNFRNNPEIVSKVDTKNTLNKYELFPGVEANEQQKEAIDKFNDFLNGKIKVNNQSIFATLQGKGGTGKTTILKKIIGDRKKILYIAPTHKAKEVLSNATGKKATTLAVALGIKLDENTGKFEQKEKNPAKIPVTNAEIIVIDEGSMVSDSLFNLIKNTVGSKTKVILMGDRRQLPPVGQDSDSIVFDYTLQELTERMRQSKESPIVPVTDFVADNIENIENIEHVAIKQRDNKYNKEDNSGVLFTKDMNTTIDMFLEDYKLNPGSTKIITFNNENHSSPQSVGNLNKLVRAKLFSNTDTDYNVGEQLMAYNTIGSELVPVIANAVDYTIVDNKGIINRSVQVSADSYAKGYRYINVNVSEHLLTLKNNITGEMTEVNLPTKESKLQIKNMVSSYYNNGPDQDIQMGVILDNTFPKMEYGYAISSHKSQGSTYRNAYVMEDNILGNRQGTIKQMNQSLYVAVSRPSHKLVILSNRTNEVNIKQELSKLTTIDQLMDYYKKGVANGSVIKERDIYLFTERKIEIQNSPEQGEDTTTKC